MTRGSVVSGAVFLEGDRVSLRTVEESDRDFLHRYWNSPAIRPGFAWNTPQRKEDVADTVRGHDTAVHLLSCVDQTPIGLLWLFGIDRIAGRAEIGFWIIPDRQGQGYGTEAARLGVRFAFEDQRLHKVMARVLEGNRASARILSQLGFEQEGQLRDHYYVNGRWLDAILYGRFNEVDVP